MSGYGHFSPSRHAFQHVWKVVQTRRSNRIEVLLSNVGYWYRRAGMPSFTAPAWTIGIDRAIGSPSRRPRPVEFSGAGFEGGDHAAHRFGEQRLDQLLQEPGAELEIDVEVDRAALRVVFEDPVVVEILERAFLVAMRWASGSRRTRLVKRSRNILKPITRSAMTRFPSHLRIRAATHQGRKSG
jgi:hypothetical protein